MKVNLGCGKSYLDGWVNVDANPDVRADVYMEAFEFVRAHGAEVDEIYMGHFLEHLMPASAVALLSLIADEVPEGARVSAVVPDMRAIFAAYDAGEISNVELNDRYIYSYEQPSHHVWCHDADSLEAAFERAGYTGVQRIDPLTWEPVFWKAGPESRWQCGVSAHAPSKAADRPLVPDDDVEAPGELQVSADEVLLNRIRKLRAEVDALRSRNLSLEPPVEAAPEPPVPRPAPADALAPREGEPSLFDRLPRSLVPTARKLLPVGSPQRRFARFGVETARIGRQYADRLKYEWIRTGLRKPDVPTYERWQREHEVTHADLAHQRRLSGTAVNPIGLHVIVTHRGGRTGLERTLRALGRQSWAHWTATVIGDPSGAAVVARAGEHRVTFRAARPDASTDVANAVLADVAPRDFVTFIESGDLLAPDCAFEVAETRDARPDRRPRVLGRRSRRRPWSALRAAVPAVVVTRGVARRELPRRELRPPEPPHPGHRGRAARLR